MNETNYEILSETAGVPIKAWTRGVAVERAALEQLKNVAALPFIFKHVAAMPDVHWGIGATVGSVIPTMGAVIPAAVGVDIGCGMMAVKTSLKAADLPDTLAGVRRAIEKAVPHGRTQNGGRGDRGAWGHPPEHVLGSWKKMESDYKKILSRHPKVETKNPVGPTQLGTLGGGNHFVELCLDESQNVWIMLHSGSRGIGNRLGTYFIELAKKDMRHHIANLPDANLAYFQEGSPHFQDYVFAVEWAQNYARLNRELMMKNIIHALNREAGLPAFTLVEEAVNCHHNYVQREKHFGQEVLLTRKGAVRAGKGDLGIIPGSMGARSYIVRGKGNPQSFESCSHGAGRLMSRNEAKKRFTLADHARSTEGVECRKDKDVLDETPAAYKPIETVMAAQSDLVDVVAVLKQVVCVKG